MGEKKTIKMNKSFFVLNKEYNNLFKINKKAQVSHEALMVLGVIFFIFIIVLSIYFHKNADVLSSNQEIEERTECLKLANTISGIFYLGGEMSLILYQDLTVFPEQQRIETEHTFCTLVLDNIAQNCLSNGTGNCYQMGYQKRHTNPDFFIVDSGEIDIYNEDGWVIIDD